MGEYKAYENDCEELILQDVILIDIYKSEDVKMALPRTIANLTQANVTIGAVPVLRLGFMSSDSSMVKHQSIMDSAATIKLTESVTASGRVRTMDLQIPVINHFDEVDAASSELSLQDITVIFGYVNGTYRLFPSLPNTSSFAVEENSSTNRAYTIKIGGKAMSALVKAIIS